MPKVLLVEDDNNLREIFEMRLQAEGYDTITAGDGEEALVVAMKEKPDLIIADVMMPRMSGFEMLETLRAAPEMAKTKVIMMTALGQAEDQARGTELGVVKYLVKSQVTLEDFAREVGQVLSPTAAGAQAPAAQSSSLTNEASSVINNKLESEKSMDPTPTTDPTTPTPPADPAGGNPISGSAPADGQQTTADEQSTVQSQVNDFASSTPAGDSSAPAGDSPVPSDVPVTPPPADPAGGASDPAAPAGDGSTGAPV